jgi:predicted  nucleic acid-binding Zn-ribbon protein
MKKLVLVIGVFSLLFLNGCVERSEKYKALQARLDSVQVASNTQTGEIESLLAGINEISAGMQSIREAEQLLVLESTPDQQGNAQSKIAALKTDLNTISAAIASYKEQIAKLESSGKRQSAELRKLIANLKAEVAQKEARINDLSAQLAEKEKELGLKNEEITGLNKNVASLQQESASQKATISAQDQNIHLGHYILGSKKDLKAKNVITRNGIFSPLSVSTQALKAAFTSVDIREVKSIPLNSKKAKIVSLHPANSYTITTDANKNLTLTITDVASFWKQTRYLVVII